MKAFYIIGCGLFSIMFLANAYTLINSWDFFDLATKIVRLGGLGLNALFAVLFFYLSKQFANTEIDPKVEQDLTKLFEEKNRK